MSEDIALRIMCKLFDEELERVFVDHFRPLASQQDSRQIISFSVLLLLLAVTFDQLVFCFVLFFNICLYLIMLRWMVKSTVLVGFIMIKLHRNVMCIACKVTGPYGRDKPGKSCRENLNSQSMPGFLLQNLKQVLDGFTSQSMI